MKISLAIEHVTERNWRVTSHAFLPAEDYYAFAPTKEAAVKIYLQHARKWMKDREKLEARQKETEHRIVDI